MSYLTVPGKCSVRVFQLRSIDAKNLVSFGIRVGRSAYRIRLGGVSRLAFEKLRHERAVFLSEFRSVIHVLGERRSGDSEIPGERAFRVKRVSEPARLVFTDEAIAKFVVHDGPRGRRRFTRKVVQEFLGGFSSKPGFLGLERVSGIYGGNY